MSKNFPLAIIITKIADFESRGIATMCELGLMDNFWDNLLETAF